jgi:hypothetical protein
MSSKKNQKSVIPKTKPRNPFHDHPLMRKSHGHTKGRQKDEQRKMIEEGLAIDQTF